MDGKLDKLKGQAKEQYGKLTDDQKKVVEGKVDQAKGEAKERIGEMKDKFNKKEENK